jgi:hypothetical protein
LIPEGPADEGRGSSTTSEGGHRKFRFNGGHGAPRLGRNPGAVRQTNYHGVVADGRSVGYGQPERTGLPFGPTVIVQDLDRNGRGLGHHPSQNPAQVYCSCHYDKFIQTRTGRGGKGMSSQWSPV